MREFFTKHSRALLVIFSLVITLASYGKAITVTSGGIKYKSDKNQTYLMVVAAAYTGDIVVPASVYVSSIDKELPVTEVGSSAFSELDDLNSVTLPESVTTIGNYAFDSSVNLKTVKMGDNVKSIGHWAFRNCYALEGLTLSANLESIGNYVFDKNLKMTQVTLPATMKNIGGFVFEGNPQLLTVYSLATVPPAVKKGYLDGDEIYTIFDDDDYGDRVLYVPAGCADDYKLEFGWNQFKEIREISPTNIDNIDGSAKIEIACNGKNSLRVYVSEPTTVKCYDLSGRLLFAKSVGTGNTVVDGVPSGVVVVNGKKVVVE